MANELVASTEESAIGLTCNLVARGYEMGRSCSAHMGTSHANSSSASIVVIGLLVGASAMVLGCTLTTGRSVIETLGGFANLYISGTSLREKTI